MILQGCISCGLEGGVFVSAWCRLPGTTESSAQSATHILGSRPVNEEVVRFRDGQDLRQAPHTSGLLWVFWN